MSKSWLKPKIEETFIEGAKTAQKYYSENFNDNSFMVIKVIPVGVYHCVTENNPEEHYYFQVKK